MASSSHPTRSVSFPSRSLFNTLKIEDTLNKLKSRDFSSASTSGCLGAETIHFGLLSLVELYGNVQQLILSSSTQQALLRQDQGKLVEEALESSVGLIDTCSTVRDLIVRLKEQVRDLQSALRRKGYLSVESEINVYMSLRKKLAKDVVRCLKVLKQSEGKYGLAAPLPNLDPSLALLVSLIREVYAVTMSVFKSLFLFLSVPAKATKWSLISRLVAKRHVVVSNKSEEIKNEVAGVNVALDCIDDTKAGVLLVRGRIQALDASIQILEGELECLSRSLVQNRVSLLNILTQ